MLGAVSGSTAPVLVILTVLLRTANDLRTWKTIYMDDDESCQISVRNDDLAEGDRYLVKSDSWQGHAPWARRPAECTVNINFGDRLVAVNLVEWWCDKVFKDPFLAIYDTCLGNRINLLARFNCSSLSPSTVYSSSTCMSIYHYRGHTRWGYFFSLEVLARYEVIAFPAGGIAAIIIISIVVVMVAVKILCVLTGYENRLPVINVDLLDGPKQTLLTVEGSSGGGVGGEGSGSQHVTGATGAQVGVPSTSGEGSSRQAMFLASTSGHALLAKSNSTGTPGPSSSASSRDCWDGDYSPPRLKRYCSVRASRILRL